MSAETDDTKKAWGYVRLSQRGRDGSIDGQKQAIREYVRGQSELDLVTTRNDGTRTSGFDSDRQEYQILLENIRQGSVDAIVVRDRARLARDFDDRLNIITTLRENNAELHVTEGGGRVHIDDVQNAAMECVHAAMDHIKKMAEIRRSRDALAERASEDAYQGGEPYGLQFDEQGKYLVPAKDNGFEAALKAIELADDGMSQRSIAAETGIHRSTVSNILDRKDWYIAAENGVPIGGDGPVEEPPNS